jgi:hypothetical protein
MKRIVFLFLAVALTSCDLFTTRTPESPTTASTNLVPASTPAQLFTNFKSSIEDQILDNYMTCFVDTAYLKKQFKFVASSGSVSQFSSLLNWGIDAEKQYFKSVTTISSSISLTLSNESSTLLGDSAVYQYDYKLSVTSNDVNVNGDYEGTATFRISYDSQQQWVIVQWTDARKNENALSWSELKGRLY